LQRPTSRAAVVGVVAAASVGMRRTPRPGMPRARASWEEAVVEEAISIVVVLVVGGGGGGEGFRRAGFCGGECA
jgi:hypothetical protein